MSDNPYQSPASTKLAHFSAGEPIDACAAGFGAFIWIVLILDGLFCASMMFFLCLKVFSGHASSLGSFQDWRLLLLQYGFLVGACVCALTGDVLILAKRRVGIPLAFASIFLVIVFWGSTLCQPGSMLLLFWRQIAIATLLRAGWLTIYGIAVKMASREMSRLVSRNYLATQLSKR